MTVVIKGKATARSGYEQLRKKMRGLRQSLETLKTRIATEDTDWGDTFGPLIGHAEDDGRAFIARAKASAGPTWAELTAAGVEAGDYASAQDMAAAFDALETACETFTIWMRGDSNVRRQNVDFSDPLGWREWDVPESVQKLPPTNPIALNIVAQIDILLSKLGPLE